MVVFIITISMSLAGIYPCVCDLTDASALFDCFLPQVASCQFSSVELKRMEGEFDYIVSVPALIMSIAKCAVCANQTHSCFLGTSTSVR